MWVETYQELNNTGKCHVSPGPISWLGKEQGTQMHPFNEENPLLTKHRLLEEATQKAVSLFWWSCLAQNIFGNFLYHLTAVARP